MKVPTTDQDLPGDLVLVLIFTFLATGATVFPVINRSPLRFVLGLVYVFFVPGYVLVATLFPRTLKPVSTDYEDFLGPVDRNFTGLERVALSVGLSISVVALLALIIDASPLSLSLTPLLSILGGFTIIGTAIATRRRLRLPPENRFRLNLRSRWQQLSTGAAEIRSDRIINIFLVLSILLASASIAYAATTPRENQTYTEFYLLSENSSGNLVANNYTAPDSTDRAREVIVGIKNHEYERVNYSTIIVLQQIKTDNSSDTIISSREVRRYDVTLSQGETERTRVDIPLIDRSGRYRLEFLLYKGGVPERPSPDKAYRYTHLLINETKRDGPEEATANE